ncbi:3D domain-containing protein [Clostridium cochlearium]|uniref:3D domain-containing protein n=1 Tax=Clostridium cochlearium TaxID=1494 RepID=UPI0015706451|nr:3D domain-containing protein [Clostridium cochlearium]NSJ91700.1 DUF348 domain-containing protein [Coprococcus sp. MSK.21.13]MBU5269969.1 G5 domain-containing protein [Clostridium cochlearium]MCG4572682.1 3D domain-containing protein [Clostridium cochlearium]MCG4579598.1 3D domain-containing protein [Clostridium cochlearium]MDU1443111.1 3D domain-containing protein [Clostridium cochlearium]
MVEECKKSINKYFSNENRAVIITTFVLIIIAALVFSAKKTLYVNVDGKEKKIITFKSDIKDVLSTNGIQVGAKDKVTPKIDNKVNNGDKIYIKRAVDVQLEVDGKKLSIKSAEDNIDKMLKAEGINIKNEDKILPSKTEKLKDGLKVAIVRVDSKVLKEVKSINFSTVTKQDINMKQGENKTIQEGKPGEKVITTKVIYENGKEIARKVISEVVTKKPVEKIIAMGNTSSYIPSRGGNFQYSNAIKMKATAYTADYQSTGKNPGDPGYGITATGTVARRSQGGYSTIAVDPRVIPLGTKVYVEGYGYAIAEDTGGAIKGNRIDVFVPTNSEAYQWGVRWVNLYILK